MLPPYGAILESYNRAKIKLDYHIVVYVGKTAWPDCKATLAKGQACLCLPPRNAVTQYRWPVKNLRLIVHDTGEMTYPELQKIVAYLLKEGAQAVYLQTDLHPTGLFINDLEKEDLC